MIKPLKTFEGAKNNETTCLDNKLETQALKGKVKRKTKDENKGVSSPLPLRRKLNEIVKHPKGLKASEVTEEEIRLFATKISELYNSLLRYSLYLTKNKVDAEDLLSESILKALKNYKSYDERNSLKSYMNTIIHNTFVNNYHRGQRELEFRRMLEYPENYYVLDSSDYESMEMLKVLDKTSQQVVYLADVMGYKYKEIATMLEIPEGTVMSKLNRGRKKIKERLKEVGY